MASKPRVKSAPKSRATGAGTDEKSGPAASEARARGRPSKYRPEFVRQAEKLCELGATDAQLAEFFEVGEATINRWKEDFPEFRETLTRAKAEADALVEKSLFQRARGYSHPAVKILTVALGGDRGSEVQQVPYTEHYPPDTTACIYWLKNRAPDRWRDKVDHELRELMSRLTELEAVIAQRTARAH
jgi:hypothetical protein